MQRCCHCHGRFGLVSHRHLFKRFCSRTCSDAHRRDLTSAIWGRLGHWCSALLTSAALAKFLMSGHAADGASRYARIPSGPPSKT
jgi:hypothetical protein